MGALKDFEAAEIERVLKACTSCGKCYEACPMTAYSPLLEGTTAARDAAVAGVLDVLRGGGGTPEGLAWIGVCTRSGECVPACPERVDPKMMMRLGRMVAFGGLGGKRLIQVRDDPEYYPRIRAFAALQLDDREREDWL